MSIIKKCDVENYLLTRRQRGKLPYQPVSQPDATGFSGVEPGPVDLNADHSIKPTLKRLSSTGVDIPAVVVAPGSARA